MAAEPYGYMVWIYDSTWNTFLAMIRTRTAVIKAQEPNAGSNIDTIWELLASQDVVALWITALAVSVWWEALADSENLESLYYEYYSESVLYLYDVTTTAEVITWFMRNWTKYVLDWTNWVPDWWNVWQILKKTSSWAARLNLPTPWIQRNATWTTSTVWEERVWTNQEFEALSSLVSDKVYNVIE